MKGPLLALVLTPIVLTSLVSPCHALPDIRNFFDGLFHTVNNDVSDADAEPRDRVKRQDPGIGDESQVHYEIRSSSLPTISGTEELNSRYMPTLGNGHISATVYDDALYMNGFYSGIDGESHRAYIPARIMSRIQISSEEIDAQAVKKFTLNAQEGYFEEYIDCEFAYIWHKVYIHQKYIRVLVSEIFWQKKPGQFGGKLILNYPSFEDSPDVLFGEPDPIHGHFQSTGTTRSAETGASTRTVYVYWMDPVTQLPVQGDTGNYTVIMSLDTQDSSARTEFDECLRIITDSGGYELFRQHANAWRTTWSKGRVEVEGDTQLAKITTFAQYYLMSNLPALQPYQAPQHTDFFYGLGRNSLAKGASGKDYQGHIMWDSEVYLLPAIVLFHPDLVKEMLRYRSEQAPRAAAIAERMGVTGYKYPWRSAYTGAEVSPDGCLECADRKMHVSAGVAWGIRQYFSATQDRDFIINTDYDTCDITREIARFFAEQAVYDTSTGRYDLRGMTGPDETFPDVDNNAYTVAAASLAIHWARYMACQCQRNEREEVPDEWIQIALYLNLPFDNVRRLHNQFEGFDKLTAPRVSQADTILMTYPLNWNMSRDIMRHDLEYYEQFTNDRSPALTWSFFTVGWKWVNEQAKLNSYFLKSYQDYLIQPFKIWTEYNEGSQEDQNEGSVNFLPGMGGFLQSLIYGFGGVRIRPDMLEFHNPMPPTGSVRMRFVGFNYLGSNMTIEITQDSVTLQVLEVADFPLVLLRNETSQVEESLPAGSFVTIERPELGFYIYSTLSSGCEHPRDHIYMPWGYSPWIDSAPERQPSKLLTVFSAMLILMLSWLRTICL